MEDSEDNYGHPEFDIPGFIGSAGDKSNKSNPETTPKAKTVADVAPVVDAPAPSAPPAESDEPKGRTILEYAMESADFDQRPAFALAKAQRKMATVAEHFDSAAKHVDEAVKVAVGIEGFAKRGNAEFEAFFFGADGLVDRLKSIFATERQLNREAATGGLVDAAAAVEEIVEKFGRAKIAEFDAHAVTKIAELDRELHRITLSGLEKTLESVIAEKSSLAEQRAQLDARNTYSRRVGIAYAVAGVFFGATVALLSLWMR